MLKGNVGPKVVLVVAFIIASNIKKQAKMEVSLQLELRIFLVAVIWWECHAEVCCFPKQWEGNVTYGKPGLYGAALFSEINADVSFDITEQRIREYIPASRYLLLLFYKEGVAYLIENSECYKGATGPMPSSLNCVPEGAHFLRKYQIGGTDNIYIKDYTFISLRKTSEDPLGQSQTVRSVTDMCIPVEDKVVENAPYPIGNVMYTLTYENITPGIKDPSVFDVPSICTYSARKMKGHSTERNHLLRSVFHGMRVMFYNF